MLPEELYDDAVLLTSELASNAAEHGGDGAVLEVHLPGDRLHVGVTDDGSPSAAPPALGRGRGLLLVEVLASRWGTQALPAGGTLVWFDLDVRAR